MSAAIRQPRKPPFDAYRIVIWKDADLIDFISISRVRVISIYKSAKLAQIKFGTGLHSETTVPFAELFSTPESALAQVAKFLPSVRYRSAPTASA